MSRSEERRAYINKKHADELAKLETEERIVAALPTVCDDWKEVYAFSLYGSVGSVKWECSLARALELLDSLQPIPMLKTGSRFAPEGYSQPGDGRVDVIEPVKFTVQHYCFDGLAPTTELRIEWYSELECGQIGVNAVITSPRLVQVWAEFPKRNDPKWQIKGHIFNTRPRQVYWAQGDKKVAFSMTGYWDRGMNAIDTLSVLESNLR